MIAPIAETLIRKDNAFNVADACVESFSFSAYMQEDHSLIGSVLLGVAGTDTTLRIEDTVDGLDDKGNFARTGWRWIITTKTEDGATQSIEGEASFEHWTRLHLTLLNVFGRKAGGIDE